ncbi:MAG: putative ubiquitin-RnfH superfamily antitoxin RatB of RatAB toxin-antitoxin module [Colwellia sp.]|jgi:putative ubiquitin-RnfH superfamily antitoxin RatB of RatAB toxin-antitoxin module
MVDSKITEQKFAQSKIQIEVVYGLPTRQELITIMVEDGTLLEQGIIESGILNVFEEIDLTINKVGIWNRSAKLTDTLRDLDRIEIYRPLIADPKEVRKRRAEKAKEEGRADKVTGGRVDPRRSKSS